MIRLLRWTALNGTLWGLIYLALFEGQEWAGNLARFMCWFFWGASLLVFLVLVVTDTMVTSDDEEWRQKVWAKMGEKSNNTLETCRKILDGPIPRWLDLTYDWITIAVLIGAGWWMTGLAYLFMVFFQALLRVSAKNIIDAHDKRLEAALGVKL